MSTEGEDIDLELKKIQLARERMALEDELRSRERKQAMRKAGDEAMHIAGKGVQKAGEAVQVAAFVTGYLGARTAKASKSMLERLLHWAAVFGVLWIAVTIGWLVVDGLKAG